MIDTPYNHAEIEKKWQKRWSDEGIFTTPDIPSGKKCYILDMFPYPSGEGLHVGHPKGYIATDVYSRMKMMQGYDVLHPMGWDAFGLPAENYAIKNKVHPRVAVEKNIARFKEQLSKIGFTYDWGREINTTDPTYYKWTQWIFLQLYKKGLAYESFEPINWCPSCQTGLANEDLDQGKCERCGSVVEKRPMRQWMLKITDYAEKLLDGLEDLPWPKSIKESQKNWIGKSEGAELLFPLEIESMGNSKRKFVLLHGFEGSPSAYDWLADQLRGLGHEVVIPVLPDPSNPTEKSWVEAVLGATTYDEHTVLFGYSLGAVAALKALEKMPNKIAGVVLAGGFVDPAFADHSRIFEKDFNWSFDVSAIKNKVGYMHFLHDTTDTAISSDQASRLGKLFDVQITYVQASKPHFCGEKEFSILNYLVPSLAVFTTRPDTLFGVTYMVLSPEHAWITLAIDDDHDVLENKDEVKAYVKAAAEKTEIERTAEGKEKTGVQVKGVWAVNPATGEKIPVWVADYVLAHYGTGAVMAVPGHDERDRQFAEKYKLPITQVVAPYYVLDGDSAPRNNVETLKRDVVDAVIENSDGQFLLLEEKDGGVTHYHFVGGGTDGEDEIVAIKREIIEETGYTDFEVKNKIYGGVFCLAYRHTKNKNQDTFGPGYYVKLQSDTRVPSEVEQGRHAFVWVDKEDVRSKITWPHHQHIWDDFIAQDPMVVGDGKLINSGEYTGTMSVEAREKMTEKFGKKKVQYKLRDWVFSRQRYWGEPIPLIHCEKCGVVPVPEDQLPVLLPEVEHYEPTGTGESPLANILGWVNTTCPTCDGPAKRETNTMPQWAGSSWYYLRFIDPENTEALVDSKKEKAWMNVDVYVGGAEHATRHLIYARFWHMVLHDLGYVSTPEPFDHLEHVGLILAEDGRKMSKRWGNVVNPDDIVVVAGADTLRLYEMFMGPFNQAVAWSTAGISGPRRFIERVWRMKEKVGSIEDSPELVSSLHRTIRRVTDDTQAFRFNTAISTLMEFLNGMEKESGVSKATFETFLLLLAPYAPHVSEELWEQLGNVGMISRHTWPTHDESLAVQKTVSIAIQVNGKVRGEIIVDAGASREEVEKLSRELPNVTKYLGGGEIRKVIYVPGKLLNFVCG